MKKSLAKNAAYKAVLNIFNLFVPLLVGPYIARTLAVESLGMYNRVFSEFQVFFTLAAFGIYNYGLREMSKIRHDKTKMNKLFTNLFIIGVISNVVMAVIYIFYFMNRATGYDMVIYTVMLIQIVGNIFYIEFINEAVENYGFITKKTIIIRILYLAGMFMFVKSKDDVLIYAVIICLTVLINNLASFFYLKKYVEFDFSEIKIMHHLIPLVVALVLANVEILYTQFDKLMLGWYYSPIQSVSDVAVSNYFIPSNLMAMVGTIPLSLVSVAIPRLSMFVGEQDKAGYEDTLSKTTKIFLVMIIPMSFGVMALSQEAMWVFAGEQYPTAWIVLIVAAICRIVYAYQSILTNLIMYVNGLERQLVAFLAVFGVCNVALNFTMLKINAFNPATLLATTGISVLLFNIAVTYYLKKNLDLNFRLITKNIVGYLLVSALFIPISILVHSFNLGYILNMIIIISICVPIFIIYLVITKDDVLIYLLDKFKINKIINKFKKDRVR
ncbi:MAG: oligosaccharide flippase family protein [Erysipelotrichaceae bacterium]